MIIAAPSTSFDAHCGGRDYSASPPVIIIAIMVRPDNANGITPASLASLQMVQDASTFCFRYFIIPLSLWGHF